MEEYNKSYGANNHTSLLSHAQSQSPPYHRLTNGRAKHAQKHKQQEAPST